jgi:hypothetical protein
MGPMLIEVPVAQVAAEGEHSVTLMRMQELPI